MRFPFLATVMASCVSSAAIAQVSDAPRTAAEAAADRAEAQALIAGTTHPELFENVTTSSGPEIRHRATGMVCDYEPGDETNNLVVYAYDDATEDVSCSSRFGEAVITLYAYRYTPAPSPDTEAQSSLAPIIDRFPDWTPYEGRVASASIPGFTRPRTHVWRGSVTINGVPSMTKLLLMPLGDWFLKQRMTVPLHSSEAGDAVSETVMLLTARTVIAHLGLPADGPPL